MKILYVCTANVCRSPAAEFYMRHLFDRLEIAAVAVASAGILEMDGAPADPIVVRIAAERGIDLGPHRSKLATPEMIAESDEIIVMERRHRAWIAEHHPSASRKVSLIREPEESADLYDPVGGSENDYRRALELLFGCIERRALAFKYPV